MKILVKVKAQAKEAKIEKISDREFVIWVKEAAKQGRANQAVIKALGTYLDIAKSRIEITQGHKNKNKVITII